MNSSENPLYNALVGNQCHTIVFKIGGTVSDIIGMSTNPSLPGREHKAQLQYKGHEIFINNARKTLTIILNSAIIFYDADKAERQTQIDVEAYIEKFLALLLDKGYTISVEGITLSQTREILGHLNCR